MSKRWASFASSSQSHVVTHFLHIKHSNLKKTNSRQIVPFKLVFQYTLNHLYRISIEKIMKKILMTVQRPLVGHLIGALVETIWGTLKFDFKANFEFFFILNCSIINIQSHEHSGCIESLFYPRDLIVEYYKYIPLVILIQLQNLCSYIWYLFILFDWLIWLIILII